MPYYKANGTMTHVHHRIPTHMTGGTANNHPDNLVELTVEQHAQAHEELFLKHGQWQDKYAACMLRNTIVPPDVQAKWNEAAQAAAKKALSDRKVRARVSQAIREAQLGRKHPRKIRKKISDGQKAAHAKGIKYTCPHCQATGGRLILRWHFDNCAKVTGIPNKDRLKKSPCPRCNRPIAQANFTRHVKACSSPD